MIILNFSQNWTSNKVHISGDVVYISDSNLPMGMLSIGDVRIMACSR